MPGNLRPLGSAKQKKKWKRQSRRHCPNPKKQMHRWVPGKPFRRKEKKHTE